MPQDRAEAVTKEIISLVRSMTGYGRSVQTLSGREFTVEIRSVNNRYLDCTVKLPRAFSFAEDSVKQAVKQAVQRGKVDVFITVNSQSAEDVQVSLNKPVLEGYLKAMKTMVAEYGVADDLSASVLSRLPEVFVVEKPQADEAQLKADLLTVVQDALDSYNRMRAVEGAALEADLRSRGDTILALVAQVEQASPQTVAEYRRRLAEKMQEILENKSLDESRILTEAAIFADKVAVDEETVRLRSHLEQMNQMLTQGGALGRKLDFLIQEMNREANTTGSKCTDVKIARIVVDIKAELEKIREQTQNLE